MFVFVLHPSYVVEKCVQMLFSYIQTEVVYIICIFF